MESGTPLPGLIPPADPLAEALGYPAALLDTTLDQLRTLIVVRGTGSALQAARLLGREQSSVQKQLDTLNRTFRSLCGEALVGKRGRGKDFVFTPTGEAVVERARGMLADLMDDVQAGRRRLGATLTAGTTEFTLWLLARAWERLAGPFGERGVDFRLVHVRTRDFWSRLDEGQVDVLCGSVLAPAGERAAHGKYDVIEWRRGSPVLLTNLPEDVLPGPTAPVSALARLPLVVPVDGVIAGFFARWFGPAFRERLTVAAQIDDAQYGIALLRSRLARGCMLVTTTLARRVAGNSGLRVVELVHDLEPKLEMVSAVFARAGERERYAAHHPLNLLWEALREEIAETGYPSAR
ncbi:LysR family transcriptional regulator [Nonomuraea typhae]|uniref:LysR family transcriptional regulator n=1 Tax=Nonomuraea typhae TaxID=2603600 RepID=UPI001C6846B7|nr:LysR family transcriptional regulator [Nonomuraea typhae]